MSDEHTDTTSRAPGGPENAPPTTLSPTVPSTLSSASVTTEPSAATSTTPRLHSDWPDGTDGPPKRRRRRGSRGGRNRRKPGTGAGTQSGGESGEESEAQAGNQRKPIGESGRSSAGQLRSSPVPRRV